MNEWIEEQTNELTAKHNYKYIMSKKWNITYIEIILLLYL